MRNCLDFTKGLLIKHKDDWVVTFLIYNRKYSLILWVKQKFWINNLVNTLKKCTFAFIFGWNYNMDSIRIFGYKSFKKLSVQLHPINLLIGANGAGKSNFLSLFEMLGNIYEKRLGAYVAQVGGVDKLLKFRKWKFTSVI